jgi:flagellar biosynthesis GTPase FlhF
MASLADLPEIIGFFSYSREDDESYKGRLSVLREAIQHELSAQLGRSKSSFRLWQDKEAIAPGRLWEAEIKTAVEQSVFFIPIVTPRAVNSDYCKFEFEAFLAREQMLDRADLVFPILYVPVPALADEARWRDHPVLSMIGRRQYVDWQTFRYADAHTPAMREDIARFCNKIVDALQRSWASREERAQREEAETRARAEEQQRREAAVVKARDEENARLAQKQAEVDRIALERQAREAETKRRADENAARKRAEADARQRAKEERRAAAPPKRKRRVLSWPQSRPARLAAIAGIVLLVGIVGAIIHEVSAAHHDSGSLSYTPSSYTPSSEDSSKSDSTDSNAKDDSADDDAKDDAKDDSRKD